MRRIPGANSEGQVDIDALLRWVTEARGLCREHGRIEIGDGRIGQWLSKASSEDDSHWPCRPVCDVLEAIASEDMATGFEIGVHNGRGVTAPTFSQRSTAMTTRTKRISVDVDQSPGENQSCGAGIWIFPALVQQPRHDLLEVVLGCLVTLGCVPLGGIRRDLPDLRPCSTPGTNSSSIWRSRRRRHVGERTRPVPPPRRTPRRPPPRTTRHRVRAGLRGPTAAPPGASSRLRTGGRRVAGHRPSVRRGLHPVHRGATRDHRLSRHPWLAPL